jgi:hypothetical protein
MNPAPAPPVNRRRGANRWLWVLVAALFLLPVMLAAGVASCFRSSADTKALLSSLEKSNGAQWRKQIVVSMGGFTLGAIRAGLSLARLNPEARAVLQSVWSVEVGLYQLPARANSPDRAATLAAADTALSARGWDRVVGVMDGGDLVAVYAPVKNASARQIECCLLVFDGRQMVVAYARANPEPLLRFWGI